MRLASRLYVVLAVLSLSACSSGTFLDAGADAPPLPAQNFDVSTSGTDTCPGQLYGVASQNSATCSRAPERCVSDQDAQLSEIECLCNGADGGQGLWECHQLRP
jgi:hypothetical protein